MKKTFAFSVAAMIVFSILTVPALAEDKEVAIFIDDCRLYQEKISEAFDSLQLSPSDTDNLQGLFYLLEYSSENLLNEIEKMNKKGCSRTAMARLVEQSMDLFHKEFLLLFIIHMRCGESDMPNTDKRIKDKIIF